MPTAIEKARALGAEALQAISDMSAAAVSNNQAALPDITARAVSLAEAVSNLSEDAAPAEAPAAPAPADPAS